MIPKPPKKPTAPTRWFPSFLASAFRSSAGWLTSLLLVLVVVDVEVSHLVGGLVGGHDAQEVTQPRAKCRAQKGHGILIKSPNDKSMPYLFLSQMWDLKAFIGCITFKWGMKRNVLGCATAHGGFEMRFFDSLKFSGRNIIVSQRNCWDFKYFLPKYLR